MQTLLTATNNQAGINTDTSKVFIGKNRYDVFPFSLANSTYSDVTHKAGTVMGRIGSTLKVVPFTSGASDGSQVVCGILAEDVTIPASSTTTKNVTLCVEGDVDQNKVLLQGSDTLNTLVSNRPVRDKIGAETVGIKLVVTTELTEYDNS